MTAQELKTYIDRVLGSSIRCLLPSYWWKRLLKLVVEYAESVNKKAEEQSSSLKIILSDYESLLRAMACRFIIKAGSGDVTVEADGETIVIPASTSKTVSFLNRFKTVGYKNSTESIEILSAFTVLVKDMDGMFYSCKSLTSLDVSNFDTSNVKNMSSMFEHCSSLTSLDVSNFDTSNVKNMNYMFRDCENLTSLDVSCFNTSKVTEMWDMFRGCESLTSLDLSNFDTSNVTEMNSMFDGCKNLSSLDVSSFDTSKVTKMYDMFAGCSSLTSLDLSNFNTSNVETMGGMFSCVWTDYSNLVSLDLSSFDTSKVTSMANMFWRCTSLTSLDLSSFDTSSVKYWYRMFEECNNLTYLTLGEGFFKSSATEIDFSYLLNWNEDSFIGSVVTNSYDRATNGLPTLEIKLHSNVYAYLTDEHKDTMQAKGYVIEEAVQE